MYYLHDAAIFLGIVILLIVAGLSLAGSGEKNELFENVLGIIGVILGISEFLLWVSGSLGHFVFPIVFILPLVCIAAGFGQHRQQALAAIGNFLRAPRNLRGLELALFLYLIAVSLLTFVLTLAPPNGADYDSLVYHLAVPQQYLRAGRVVELNYDHHSYFPLGTEMLYLFGLWLRGPVLAKLFHWLMLPLSCAVLVAMGRRHFSLRSGLLAAAIFASLPVAQAEASTGYIDLGLTAFTLLAFMGFFAWLDSRDNRKLLLCALCCGFCLGTKYLGVLTFGWLFLATCAVMAHEKRIEPKPLIAFVALPLLIGGGWYLRNFLWTGNPVFPFAYGLFGGRGWTAGMASDYASDQSAYGFGRSPMDWLWLPWRLSMSPLNLAFANGKMAGGAGFWPFADSVSTGGNGIFETAGTLSLSIIGPVLLAFTAPLVFVRRKPRLIGFVLWSFVFFFVFWGLTGQYLRYLVPAFALLCLAAGWGVERYLKRSATLQWTAGIALVAWLAVTPALTLHNAHAALPVVLGQQTPQEYLSRTFPGYDAMQWASVNTPEKAKFAIFGEPRCFYLDRDYFFADDMHNNLLDYTKLNSGDDLVQALQALGATHILWNSGMLQNGGAGNAPPHIEEAVEKGEASPLYEAHGYRVYSINGQGGAR